MTVERRPVGFAGRTAGRPWLFWLQVGMILALGAVILVRALTSTGFYWKDDYSHLLISKLAWEEPSALLDIWGRPIMTAFYMPAAILSETAVRLTSLMLLLLTAALCVGIVRSRKHIFPLAAAVLLLAQPLTATIGFGALPQIPFSALLALALWLRARQATTASLLVASVLPLARLEGLVVLLIWAAILLFGRQWRRIPLLGAGMAAWALTAWAVHGDPLWLLHTSPYGILGTAYGTAGWRYLFLAFGTVVGPVVGALFLNGLGLRKLDPLLRGLALGLPLFYGLAWASGSFQTIATPVYLVSTSVPFALVAHATLEDLVERDRAWIGSAVLAVAVAALSGSARLLVLTAAVAIGLLAIKRMPMTARLAGPVAMLALALVVGASSVEPLRLGGMPRLARDLARELGGQSRRVHVSTEPAFNWFAGLEGVYGRSTVGGDFVTYIRRVPRSAWIIWDSQIGARRLTARELRSIGFRMVLTKGEGSVRLVVWERVRS